MASYEEIAVAVFGVAPGGYDSYLKGTFNKQGEGAYADFMVGLLHNLDGSAVSTNSALAGVIATNLLGNSVTTANLQWVTNYITTELNAGVDAGSLVDSLINILDGVSPSDANWGNAHTEFSNKVAVADYYTQIGGTSTTLSTLSGMLSGVNSTASSVVTEENALAASGTTGVDTYAVAANYSTSIVHNAATHSLIQCGMSL